MEEELIEYLKSHGVSGYSAQRDSTLVWTLVANKKQAEPVSESGGDEVPL